MTVQKLGDAFRWVGTGRHGGSTGRHGGLPLRGGGLWYQVYGRGSQTND